jgi:hypothetical protein
VRDNPLGTLKFLCRRLMRLVGVLLWNHGSVSLGVGETLVLLTDIRLQKELNCSSPAFFWWDTRESCIRQPRRLMLNGDRVHPVQIACGN